MFAVSKIAWAVIMPGNFLALALGLGLLAWLAGWRGLGTGLVLFAGLAFLAIAVLPLGIWLARPLEDRHPRPELEGRRIDGIIVLGGASLPALSADRDAPQINMAAERLIAFGALARAHPEARLVFAGGQGTLAKAPISEADVARRVFTELGLPVERVIFEDGSRNTHENAAMARPLADPQPGETWLLVTSALHMPRAVQVFAAQDWPVLPYPVDYLTLSRDTGVLPGIGFDLAGHLVLLNAAMREWIGLAAYRLLGRT
ncbi:YdcF family protein [Marinibaculum pumilum]|uniref:YdcF family protein n=1 Tax=Marinibaculum pumilum TaxID=1766165 RepID=A0ABV7KUI3_9PROT